MPKNTFDLGGKVAIVTGGNGGIGEAIATGLAEAGASIVIVARNQAKTAKAVEKLKKSGAKCLGIKCDVTNSADIAAAVEKTVTEFGRLDILVNDAGTSAAVPAEKMTEA